MVVGGVGGLVGNESWLWGAAGGGWVVVGSEWMGWMGWARRSCVQEVLRGVISVQHRGGEGCCWLRRQLV